MRLVDDDAAYREREPQLQRALRRTRVQPDRVTGALVAQQPIGERCGRLEVLGAIEGENRRELLAREWVRGPDPSLGDDEELRAAHFRAVEPGSRSDRPGCLRDERGYELAAGEH